MTRLNDSFFEKAIEAKEQRAEAYAEESGNNLLAWDTYVEAIARAEKDILEEYLQELIKQHLDNSLTDGGNNKYTELEVKKMIIDCLSDALILSDILTSDNGVQTARNEVTKIFKKY